MNLQEARAKLVFSLRHSGIKDQKILQLIEQTDRTMFISGIFKDRAYEDVALPIEAGQTISAPSVVARMTQALDLHPKCTVLEVGTGSGYQTTILASLSRRVYTTERVKDLSILAKDRLARLGITNATCIATDGSLGLEAQAPFDRIMITAAADDIPVTLLAQLKLGGIMVLPVGPSGSNQILLRVQKTDEGNEYTELGEVRFVPLLPGKV